MSSGASVGAPARLYAQTSVAPSASSSSSSSYQDRRRGVTGGPTASSSSASYVTDYDLIKRHYRFLPTDEDHGMLHSLFSLFDRWLQVPPQCLPLLASSQLSYSSDLLHIALDPNTYEGYISKRYDAKLFKEYAIVDLTRYMVRYCLQSSTRFPSRIRAV